MPASDKMGIRWGGRPGWKKKIHSLGVSFGILSIPLPVFSSLVFLWLFFEFVFWFRFLSFSFLFFFGWFVRCFDLFLRCGDLHLILQLGYPVQDYDLFTVGVDLWTRP